MFDKLCMKIAYLLPRRVVYWASIRLGVSATAGKHSEQIVPELLFVDSLKRWDLGDDGEK